MSLKYENRGQYIEPRVTNHIHFEMHLHNSAELLIVLNGHTYAYAYGRGGKVMPGSAFLALPNQIHYFENDSEDLLCAMLIFPPDILAEFSAFFKNSVPENPVVPLELKAVPQIVELIRQEFTAPTPYSQQILTGCLQIVLAKLLPKMKFNEIAPRNLNTTKAVLNYCNTHYEKNITLEDVAAAVHVSKYYVSGIFNKNIGISFSNFINALRIRKARELLKKENLSVTEIAYRVGFNSLRSFNRQFALQNNCTPREYQKAQAKTRQAKN